MKKWLAVMAGLLLTALVALLVFVGVRFGGGEPYADVSTDPLHPASALEEVFRYPQPLGNLAVAEDGRVFFTIHPESRPEDEKLMVWDGEGFQPFPDTQAQGGLQTPLGMVIDRQGRLWVIDHGFHGAGGPQLLAFDIDTGERLYQHAFDDQAAPLGSFLQDLQVSPDGGTVYLTDVEHGGVYVMTPDGDGQTLVSSEAIRWADALSFGPERWLYIADSGLSEVMLRGKSHIQEAGPYSVYRLRVADGAPAGH